MPERSRASAHLSGRQARSRALEPAARRSKGGRLLRRARRLAFLALLAALAAGGWWLLQSPLLRIQEVTVEGTRLLDPEDLAAVAGLRGASILFLTPPGPTGALGASPW